MSDTRNATYKRVILFSRGKRIHGTREKRRSVVLLLLLLSVSFATNVKSQNLVNNDTPIYWFEGKLVSKAEYDLLHKSIDSLNLVFDGSFENFIFCPDDNSNPVGELPDWSNSIGCNYYNSCSNTIYGAVPLNRIGYEFPADGMGYVDAVTFCNVNPVELRNYLVGNLKSKLIANNKYKVSINMSLVDSVIVSCKNIGIYFCDTIPSSYIDPTPPYTFHWNLTHQPELQFYKDLSNKVGWTTLDTTYTASGYEKYLIIGNFLSNSQSDSTNVGGNAPITGNYGWQGAIYYFDDVRITLLDGTGINSPTNLPKGEAYKVLPNPNNGSFTIQTNEFDKQVQFVLTNTMGQVVDNIPVKSSSTMYKNNNLTNGIYFYTTVCNGAVTSRGKFMVQK